MSKPHFARSFNREEDAILIITINDDFDLQKIAHCGQCFRAKEIFGGIYRFITGTRVIYISNRTRNQFEISCDEDEWSSVWTTYFDLDTNYRALRAEIAGVNDYINSAAEFGSGIRILRQEPFETLISFIISQRKSIPSITTSVERIAERFGRAVETERGTVHLFPTVDELKSATLDQLSGLGLGYRKSYILDALNKISSGELDLDALSNVDDDTLLERLKSIRGVGDKVANCVALFAYHRVDRVPIDVWIARAIDEDFHGKNVFLDINHNAGIAQQYVFYLKKFQPKVVSE